MRKVSSYVLVELLMKKIYIPTFKPKLFRVSTLKTTRKVPLSSQNVQT